jgi:hypothetical protein
MTGDSWVTDLWVGLVGGGLFGSQSCIFWCKIWWVGVGYGVWGSVLMTGDSWVTDLWVGLFWMD